MKNWLNKITAGINDSIREEVDKALRKEYNTTEELLENKYIHYFLWMLTLNHYTRRIFPDSSSNPLREMISKLAATLGVGEDNSLDFIMETYLFKFLQIKNKGAVDIIYDIENYTIDKDLLKDYYRELEQKQPIKYQNIFVDLCLEPLFEGMKDFLLFLKWKAKHEDIRSINGLVKLAKERTLFIQNMINLIAFLIVTEVKEEDFEDTFMPLKRIEETDTVEY
jgi:hypothetical protein